MWSLKQTTHIHNDQKEKKPDDTTKEGTIQKEKQEEKNQRIKLIQQQQLEEQERIRQAQIAAQQQQQAAVLDIGLPNNVLFAENLPHDVTDAMLHELFHVYRGYVASRAISGKGVAFIEFTDDSSSRGAIHGLQGFAISPTHRMKLTFAKK